MYFPRYKFKRKKKKQSCVFISNILVDYIDGIQKNCEHLKKSTRKCQLLHYELCAEDDCVAHECDFEAQMECLCTHARPTLSKDLKVEALGPTTIRYLETGLRHIEEVQQEGQKYAEQLEILHDTCCTKDHEKDLAVMEKRSTKRGLDKISETTPERKALSMEDVDEGGEDGEEESEQQGKAERVNNLANSLLQLSEDANDQEDTSGDEASVSSLRLSPKKKRRSNPPKKYD